MSPCCAEKRIPRSPKCSHTLCRQKETPALCENRQEWKAIFDSSQDGVLVADIARQKFLSGNRAIARMLGFSEKELLQLSVRNIHPPQALRRVLAAFHLLARGRASVVTNIPVRRKDGSLFYADISGSCVELFGRSCLVGFFRDVTERKRVEADLQASEQRYRGIFESSHDAMMTLEPPAWKFTTANAAMVRMFRAKSVTRLLLHSPWALSPKRQPDGRLSADKAREMIQTAIRRGACFFEWTHRRLDGTTFPAEVLLTRMMKNGEVTLQATVRDITARKQAEEALRHSERRTSDLMANLPGMAYRCRNERNWPMFFVSEGCRALTGYGKKDLESGRIFFNDLIHRDDRKRVWHAVQKALARKDYFQFTYRIRTRKREEKWIWERGHGVWNDSGKLMYLDGFVTDITEQKRAVEELHESRKMLQLVLDTIPQRVFWKDRRSVYLGCNKPFAQDCGYIHPPKLIGKTDHETASAVMADLYREDDQQVMKTGHSKLNYEEPQVKQDGSQAWLRTSKIPLRDRDGKVMGVLGTYEDITDRKKAESALRESEFWLRESQRVSHIGSYEMDVVAGSWKSSKTLDDIFGISAQYRKDVKGWERILHPDHRKSMLAYFRNEVLGRKKTFNREYKICRLNDGQTRWVLGRGSLVFDPDGKPLKMIGTIQDITARKQAEDSLEEHRHQLLQIIDTVPHMIFAKDRHGRFLLVNRALARAYGMEPKDLIGVRRSAIHKVPEEIESYLKSDREVLAKGRSKVIAGEFFTDLQGRKHILQTIRIPFKMVGAKEPCILGVSVDITEQKKVEEFRNDIVRTVSHELRTPLSIQKEGISLLLDEVAGPVSAEQKRILDAVRRNIDRLARMITGLLDISSIESGRIRLVKKETDLADLVRDVVPGFNGRADEKSIALSVKLPRRSVRIFADPDKIAQVLSNMVDNALKFTPAKGTVLVSLIVRGRNVECEVRDTGIGIAPEHLGKLFEKFQQFSRIAGPGEKGFGLGLSIIKGIMDLHGGRVRVQSKLGQGTRVAFSLPLCPAHGTAGVAGQMGSHKKEAPSHA